MTLFPAELCPLLFQPPSTEPEEGPVLQGEASGWEGENFRQTADIRLELVNASSEEQRETHSPPSALLPVHLAASVYPLTRLHGWRALVPARSSLQEVVSCVEVQETSVNLSFVK